MHVTLEFQRAMPRLKCKGRRPHVPESRREKVGGKPIGNPGIFKSLFSGFAQPKQLDPVCHAKPHRRDISDRPVAVHKPRLCIPFDFLTELDGLVEDGLLGIGQGWNGFEEIPCAFKVFCGHHPASAHCIAGTCRATCVKASPHFLLSLKDGDICAMKACITDHEGRARQCANTPTDKVCFASTCHFTAYLCDYLFWKYIEA